MDARIVGQRAGERLVHGAFGSYAVGAVEARPRARVARFDRMQFGRVVATGGGEVLPEAVCANRAVTYRPVSTTKVEPIAPERAIHDEMRHAEARMARELAERGVLVVSDGYLTFQEATRGLAVGWVKQIQELYVPASHVPALLALPTGTRTPLFALRSSKRFARYAWFLRLAEPRRGDSELSAIWSPSSTRRRSTVWSAGGSRRGRWMRSGAGRTRRRSTSGTWCATTARRCRGGSSGATTKSRWSTSTGCTRWRRCSWSARWSSASWRRRRRRRRSGEPAAVVRRARRAQQYAPRTGWSPLADLLLDVAERGRSLGVSLLGAQQTASEVERRVVANASLRVVGRLDAAEAERGESGWLTHVARQRAAMLQPGSMIVSQPEIATSGTARSERRVRCSSASIAARRLSSSASLARASRSSRWS